MKPDIQMVLNQHYMRSLIERVCGPDWILITRPAAYAVKMPEEDERDINRLIILPPRGYTSNKINQTNCFHNVESATIEIMGAVKEDKRAFSVLKNCLLNVSYNEMETFSGLDRPYLEFNIEDQDSGFLYKRYSAGEPPFHVVKVDGTGFYHTLINLSDEWLVLRLHKVLREEKFVNLEPHLQNIQDTFAHSLRQLHTEIIEVGDELFDVNKTLVSQIMRMPPDISLPALGEMLYVRDTGRHETCTAFGLILKIGQRQPDVTLDYLKKAVAARAIPSYFGRQLIHKTERKQAARTPAAAAQRA